MRYICFKKNKESNFKSSHYEENNNYQNLSSINIYSYFPHNLNINDHIKIKMITSSNVILQNPTLDEISTYLKNHFTAIFQIKGQFMGSILIQSIISETWINNLLENYNRMLIEVSNSIIGNFIIGLEKKSKIFSIFCSSLVFSSKANAYHNQQFKKGRILSLIGPVKENQITLKLNFILSLTKKEYPFHLIFHLNSKGVNYDKYFYKDSTIFLM